MSFSCPSLRQFNRTGFCIAACYMALGTGTAHAEETPWWTHVGVARVAFQESAKLYAAGSAVPGADAQASDNTTLLLEGGYKFTPNWSTSVTIGIPPTSDVTGTGSVAAVGKIGSVKYAPLVMAAQYHLGSVGPVQPYVGAGAVYYYVMKAKDGALENLKVKSGWGSVLQVGAEMPLDQRFGLYFDVKKAFIKTKATGNLTAMGGAPVQADVTLNPLVVNIGLSVKF